MYQKNITNPLCENCEKNKAKKCFDCTFSCNFYSFLYSFACNNKGKKEWKCIYLDKCEKLKKEN